MQRHTNDTVTFSWTELSDERNCHNSFRGKKLTDVASETKASGTDRLPFEPFNCMNNEATRDFFCRTETLIAAGFQSAAVHDKCACLIVVR